jgi:hypothetical protein
MFHTVSGEGLAPADLALPRARELAAHLLGGQVSFTWFVESRRDGEREIVVFDCEAEVPQAPVADIRGRERIAAVFEPGDRELPLILALRRDFPAVPHLVVGLQEPARALCIADEPYRELRSRWTAALLVQRVREWLRLTARRELHGADQPLEPLFLRLGSLVLPRSVLQAAEGLPLRPLLLERQSQVGRRWVLKFEAADVFPPDATADRRWVAAVLHCPAQQHGLLHDVPKSLDALDVILRASGFDLLMHLRRALPEWKDTQTVDARFILLLVMPKSRDADGEVEEIELVAFVTTKSLADVGVEVGVWEKSGGSLGQLLVTDTSKTGAAIEIGPFNVHPTLSRDDAARFGGYRAGSSVPIVAVGCGALGSQVVLNAVRGGFGHWTLVDDDIILPHNLARHALCGLFLAREKVHGVALLARTILDEPRAVTDVAVDIFELGEHRETVAAALESAAVIADMSASGAVARHLALDVESSAPRASIFLNPTGTDLVFLAEPRDRAVRLDALEMQYYRAVGSREELSEHLEIRGVRIRYGRSCRDISHQIPQEFVAVHGAIAARALRTWADEGSAQISLWRIDPGTMGVVRLDVPVASQRVFNVDGWDVCTDVELLEKLQRLRVAKLPLETGGVLIGSVDLERRKIYVVDTIPAPPDSQEWPTVYVRGCKGLAESVDHYQQRTHGQVHYVGEWHSHPRLSSCRCSDDDLVVLGWIGGVMAEHALPGVMLIVGDGEVPGVYMAVATPHL